ncbi:hypothetical protein N7466_006090 [Penicillium verhagenii]|uniref:uncharacterized protein n=1 Tax=Penicillium verhagenii TaxID=1562060 RepID=UPI002545956A|nr:uncharacterized protein N7466_006090 [Penicillium verhagenii]KAJ5930597.1 hypothetical protein N7466_006090 [Penicillium verhagenii]
MPRRCHTKSRRGCVQCKERHVKCDEQTPTCSLCIRRGLECMYVAPRPRRRPVSTSTSSPKNARSDRSSSQSSISHSDDFIRLPRLQEMQLFYKACESTLPSIAKDDEDRRFWNEKIPQFAVSHDYVMDSLLAVSALHLASEQIDADEIPTWLETALTYQTHATAGLRHELVTNPQNIEASFMCSAIILILVTAYPGVCRDETPVDPLYEIMTLRSILSGAAFLWMQMFHGTERAWLDAWIYQDGNNRLAIARAKYVPSSHNFLDSLNLISKLTIKSNNSEDPNIVKLHMTILQKFHTLRPFIEATPGIHRNIYRDTYKLLLQSLECWPSGQGSLIWPIRVSDEFMSLVKQGEWMALIFVLFHGLDKHLSSRKWFARESGRRLVHGVIQNFAGTFPPEWVGLVEWVRHAVEV